MIPEIYKVSGNDVKSLESATQKAFRYLHTQAPNVTYTTVAPKKADVPFGGIVVHDDGANRRVYFNTGNGAVGYTTLTVLTA